MRLASFVLAASLAATLTACGLDDQGVLPLDGSAPTDARVDVAPDTQGVDAPRVDVVTGCPTPPDCSNPACTSQGYVCTPPAPAGWSIASAVFTNDSACPAGFGPSQKLTADPKADPAECGCTCSIGSSPSCVVGSIVSSTGNGSSCMAGDLTEDANDGACMNGTFNWTNYDKVTSTPGPTGGTCSATPTTTVPAYTSTTSYVCPLLAAAPTTGCMGGEVCVATTSARSQCVVQSGSSLACPATYTVSHDVGGSVVDSRACGGPCECGAPTGTTCTEMTWTFYGMQNCKGGSGTINLDGNCDTTGVLGTGQTLSYQYTATPAGATCGTATSTPSAGGSVSLMDPETLCCLPP
jgi:hypothetical protein